MRYFIPLIVLACLSLPLSSQIYVFSDNFDLPAGGESLNNAGQNWELNTGSSGNNQWFIETTNGGTCGTGNSLFVTDAFGNIPSQQYNTGSASQCQAISPVISTVGQFNMKLSFDWLGVGEGAFTLYDYGRLLLSNNGGATWNEYDFDFTNTPTCQFFEIELGDEYENIPDFRLAFRWTNDFIIGTAPAFNIDNIAIRSEPITILPIDGITFCRGGFYELPFEVSGQFNAGNEFTMLLSDANGSFLNPTEVGSVAGTSSNFVNIIIPDNVDVSGTYFLRIISSSPVYTSTPVGPLTWDSPTFTLVSNAAELNLCNGPITVSSNAVLFELEWSTGQTISSTITVNQPGLISATGRDIEGCLAVSDTLEVLETTPIPVSITPVNPIEFCGQPITVSLSDAFESFEWSNGSTASTFVVDTVPISPIFVVATDTNGCILPPFYLDVEFITDIVLPITPPNAAICNNVSAVLTAAAGFQNYSWSNGQTGPVISINSPGLYYAVALDATGCLALSDTIEVVESQYPIANFNYIQNSGSYSISFDNLSQNGVDFEWIFDTLGTASSTDASLTFPTNGAFYVSLVATNVCGSDTVTKLVFVNFVGIEDVNLASSIKLGPVPAANELNVFLEQPDQRLEFIRIWDMSGRSCDMPNEILNAGRGIVYCGSLTPGIYLCEIGTSTGIYRRIFSKK